MAKYIIDRRRFLKRSGEAILITSVAGSVMFTDTARSYAIEIANLSEAEASALLRMCRLCYPHDHLGDMYYAVVVEALDTEAADGDVAELIKQGIADLDGLGVPFLSLSEGTQIEILEAIQEGEFFQKVRGGVVYHLYNNPLVWRSFGYEGASAEHGGYLLRGFQDAGWLMTPPVEASPPAFTG